MISKTSDNGILYFIVFNIIIVWSYLNLFPNISWLFIYFYIYWDLDLESYGLDGNLEITSQRWNLVLPDSISCLAAPLQCLSLSNLSTTASTFTAGSFATSSVNLTATVAVPESSLI